METAPYTKIIIRNMRVDMFIGVHEHEKKKPQPVVVNVEAHTTPPSDWRSDKIADILNYELIVSAIRDTAGSGHIHLVETFAEKIAHFCLKLPQASAVTVRVEKPEIFDFMDSVGVEIFRKK